MRYQRSPVESNHGLSKQNLSAPKKGKAVKKLLVTATLALATMLPAHAQVDPYAQGQRELADQMTQREVDDLLKQAYNIYHAAACKVIGENQSIPRVYQLTGQVVEHAMRTNQRRIDPATFYVNLRERLKEIKEAAVADAVKTDCSYWKEHPEEVYAIRQFATTH
jgi:hypothetical protein